MRPRNARMRIGVRHIATRRGARGRRLRPARLGKALRARVASPLRSRALRPRRARPRPGVTLPDLRRANPVVLTIDRSGYTLRLFRRLRYARSYGIAVGAAGTETPTGLYRIQSKQVNPAWHAPNRPWAGSYAGKTVPGRRPRQPAQGALAGHRRRSGDPRHRRAVVDRLRSVARVHPDARVRRDRPVLARTARLAGAYPLRAAATAARFRPARRPPGGPRARPGRWPRPGSPGPWSRTG